MSCKILYWNIISFVSFVLEKAMLMLTLVCRLFLLCVRLFDRFFIFIWNGVYYSVISQKIYVCLVAGFKFFVSNEIKIMIKKVIL